MSERNLARLIVKETGLSFRQWRQQLQLIMALQGLVKAILYRKLLIRWGMIQQRPLLLCLRKAWGKRQADILRD